MLKSITESQDGRNFDSVCAICDLHSCFNFSLLRVSQCYIKKWTRFRPIRSAYFLMSRIAEAQIRLQLRSSVKALTLITWLTHVIGQVEANDFKPACLHKDGLQSLDGPTQGSNVCALTTAVITRCAFSLSEPSCLINVTNNHTSQ